MKLALIIYIAGIIAGAASIVINTLLINKCYKDSKFKLPLWAKEDSQLLLHVGWTSWVIVIVIWLDYKESIKWHKITGKLFSKMEQL